MNLRRVIDWFQQDPDRQDRFGILLCFVLGVIVQFAGTTLNGSRYDLPAWVGLGPLVLVCVVDLWRRRAPFRALLVALVAAAVSVNIGTNLVVVVVAVDLLYAAVLYGSPRVSQLTLRLGIIGTVVIAALSAVFVEDWRIAFFVTLQTGLVLVSAVSIAFTMRRQRDFATAEAQRAEQAEQMARMDREAAVQAERHRMARELHDVIAGHLSAIALQSEAALTFVTNDAEATEQVLRSVRQNSVQSLAEMRALIELLRDGREHDSVTSPRRLADLSDLLESAGTSGLTVTHDIRGEIGTIPLTVDVAAFRIIHESLTNAAKHAMGAGVHIGLVCSMTELEIVVSNELTRRSAGLTGPGAGVDSMRRRAEALGGNLHAGPSDGAWTVRAVLPLDEKMAGV